MFDRSASSKFPSDWENNFKVSFNSAGGGKETIFLWRLVGVFSVFKIPGGILLVGVDGVAVISILATFPDGEEGVVGDSSFLFAIFTD